jgi:hypothetical protein
MSQEWWIKHEDGSVEGPLPTETIRARLYAGFLNEECAISDDRRSYKPARMSLPVFAWRDPS